jgi:hypothetical protein
MRRHFRRDQLGCLKRIVVPKQKLGYRTSFDISVPGRWATRIERHVQAFRHALLNGESSTLLFPGIMADDSAGAVRTRLMLFVLCLTL